MLGRLLRAIIGFREKNKNVNTPIKKGIILSSNCVSANAPEGKMIILIISPVVMAKATALIHFKEAVLFLLEQVQEISK